MKEAHFYARIVIEDMTERIVSETPVVYTDEYIQRVYEIDDGAILKYEWFAEGTNEINHRVSLEKAPKPNPNNLKPHVIKEINY